MQRNKRAGVPMAEDERYRILVEAITDYAVYMLDSDGIVTSWNSGAQRFKGYKPSEIIGHHFSRFYTPEDQAAGLPEKALAQRAGKASSSLKGGGCARTAAGSGSKRSSMQSAMPPEI